MHSAYGEINLISICDVFVDSKRNSMKKEKDHVLCFLKYEHERSGQSYA